MKLDQELLRNLNSLYITIKEKNKHKNQNKEELIEFILEHLENILELCNVIY